MALSSVHGIKVGRWPVTVQHTTMQQEESLLVVKWQYGGIPFC